MKVQFLRDIKAQHRSLRFVSLLSFIYVSCWQLYMILWPLFINWAYVEIIPSPMIQSNSVISKEAFWERAESDTSVPDAANKAQTFSLRYAKILDDFEKDPASHGTPLDIINWDSEISSRRLRMRRMRRPSPYSRMLFVLMMPLKMTYKPWMELPNLECLSNMKTSTCSRGIEISPSGISQKLKVSSSNGYDSSSGLSPSP